MSVEQSIEGLIDEEQKHDENPNSSKIFSIPKRQAWMEYIKMSKEESNEH